MKIVEPFAIRIPDRAGHQVLGEAIADSIVADLKQRTGSRSSANAAVLHRHEGARQKPIPDFSITLVWKLPSRRSAFYKIENEPLQCPLFATSVSIYGNGEWIAPRRLPPLRRVQGTSAFERLTVVPLHEPRFPYRAVQETD
jgi:hypothetical protein